MSLNSIIIFVFLLSSKSVMGHTLRECFDKANPYGVSIAFSHADPHSIVLSWGKYGRASRSAQYNFVSRHTGLFGARDIYIIDKERLNPLSITWPEHIQIEYNGRSAQQFTLRLSQSDVIFMHCNF